MHLLDLARVTESDVEVTYQHPRRKFFARLRGAFVHQKDGGLESVCGAGPSPAAAQRDYAKKIAGKRIVIKAAPPEPAERFFTVPDYLTY